MTRALVTQMLEAMEHGYMVTGAHAKYTAAITAAREYLATEPKPTLTEALAQQGIKLRTEFEQSKPDIKDLQANGKGPAPCARFCEANAFEIEIRRLTAKLNAQQAKRVPMTDAEAHQTLLDMAANIEKFGDGTESNEQLSSECIRFILERVDHHGITPAEKLTDWSAA